MHNKSPVLILVRFHGEGSLPNIQLKHLVCTEILILYYTFHHNFMLLSASFSSRQIKCLISLSFFPGFVRFTQLKVSSGIRNKKQTLTIAQEAVFALFHAPRAFNYQLLITALRIHLHHFFATKLNLVQVCCQPSTSSSPRPAEKKSLADNY